MSKTAHVVDGEASESDSDVEIGISPDVDSPSNTKGFVIAGEAPESDDESKLSPPQLRPIIEPERLVIPAPKSSSSATIHNSILHQKLWEANVSFRANLEGLVKHSIDISVEKLTRSDKTLLSVQESMRATNANLTLARARLKQLREQFEKANCNAALPTELLVTLSTLLRGSVYERLRWAFRLYDVDGDGAITRSELAEVVVAVHELLGRRAPPGSPASRVDDAKANEQVDRVFRKLDLNQDGVITIEEFLESCLKDDVITRSLQMFDTAL